MNKRIVSILSVFFLFCTCICASAKSPLESKVYLPHVNIAQPFESYTPVDSCYGTVSGKNMMYTSSTGEKVLFNAVNLDDKKVEFTYEITGSKAAWSHQVGPDGKVYIMADSQLFRYDPVKKEMNSLGKTLDQTACYALCFDEAGDIYVGTYPGGKILKYSLKEKAFSDLGQVIEGHKYVRSLVYKDGYLYAGTFGDTPRFVKIKASNPSQKKEISVNFKDGWYNKAELQWLYNMNLVGDYIIINGKSKTTAPLFIYDIKNETFLDHGFLHNYRGIHTSPPLNGKTYFPSGNSIFSFDTATHQITDENIEIGTMGFYGAGLAEIKNDPDLPGTSIVTVDNTTGAPILINPITKKVKRYTDIDMGGNGGQIHSIEKGVGDRLILGAFMGTKSATYDVKTGELVTFPSHQAESSLGYRDKAFLGLYTNANIQVIDYTKPFDNSNPKMVCALGEEQDRPYRMVGDGDRVYIGSYPKYGKLGGALTIMDYNTYEIKVFRNIIPGQSIMSMAVKGDKLYFSSSIFGGLGSTPSSDKACLSVFDLKTEKMIKSSIPVIPDDVGDITALGDVSFGPDGLLWVAAKNMVFAVDPDTLLVKKNLFLNATSDKIFSKESALYRPYFIRWDNDGLLYTTAGANGIKVIDPNTLECRKLDKETGGVVPVTLMTIGPDGNIYYQNYLEGSVLKMIPIAKYPYSPSEFPVIKKTLADKMALYIGKNNAVNNGEILKIDTPPFLENDRTFLPVRSVAEALQADVHWDESSQTVTLTKGNDIIKTVIGEKKIQKNDTDIPIDTASFTKNDRTFLPLRSLAEALNKNVFWDGEGLIILSNEKWSETEELTGKIASCLRYYNENMDSDNQQTQSIKDQYQAQTKQLGNPLQIANGSFEEQVKNNKIPGWERESAADNGNLTEVTSEKAFYGSNALKIVDTSTEKDATVISDFIAFNNTKQYTLSSMLYIASGRTSVGLYYYDENKQFINREDLHVTTGQGTWQHVLLKAERPIGKYVRIKLFTSPYFVSECYYDDVTLFEQ